MDFKEFETLMKRFLNLPAHWYGDLTLKFQAGDIVNVRANASYDMEIVKKLKLENTTNVNKIRSEKS